MADVAGRKDKIAAAKKKLKQFQKDGRQPLATDGRVSPGKTRGLSPQTVPDGKVGGNGYSSSNSHHGLANNVKSSASVPSLPSIRQGMMTSSTESLSQLSRHITGLIAESNAYLNGEQMTSNNGVEDLEHRNRELAALLDEHSKANIQMKSQLEELKQQYSRLQQTADADRKTFDDKLKRELGALKEQLQVHIQTIGILVAEKTELQSSVNQSQKLAESRQAEVEELAGRLKASRQRVADLERNFTSANSSNQKNEKTSKDLQKEVDKLKMDIYKLNKSNEEFQQHNLELQDKLQKKVSECARFEDSLIEVRGQLQMSELHVQQLRSGQEPASEGALKQIEELLSIKAELQSKLQQKEELATQIQRERDAGFQQYTEFISQIQLQAKQLQTQVDVLTEERDLLSFKTRELENSISHLKAKDATLTDLTVVNLEEKAQLQDQIERLNSQLEAALKNLEVQSADNGQLSRLVIEKEERIMHLEMAVEQASDAVVNKEKLLETMQGDQTALSRAMAQNKELKNQLSELQNGFVKMSTDNMEMLTKLQSEQHVAKELAARLGQQEDELKEIREQLLDKEHQLSDLHRRDAEHAANQRQELSSEDMERQIRNFGEQAPLIECLQRELSSAQDTINALTNQNSELKRRLIQQVAEDRIVDEDGSQQAQVDAMYASIRQLEMERDNVVSQLRESNVLQQALRDKLDNVQLDLASQAPATLNGDVITKVQFEALQHAMKQLEDKYTRVMRDKADLTDKAERLEHIILQLQGETDTIGEYVTLYQQQRSAMRRRFEEREGYIYQLARERIDLQTKLGELQSLVVQLLGERSMLHAYSHSVGANHPGTVTPSRSTELTNHVRPSPSKRQRREKVVRLQNGGSDDSHGDDWPNYDEGNNSDSGSDIEPTATDGDSSFVKLSPDTSYPSSHSDASATAATTYPKTLDIPDSASYTAHKIMHLLDEIGTSNLVERALDSNRYLHCSHCTGRVIAL